MRRPGGPSYPRWGNFETAEPGQASGGNPRAGTIATHRYGRRTTGGELRGAWAGGTRTARFARRARSRARSRGRRRAMRIPRRGPIRTPGSAPAANSRPAVSLVCNTPWAADRNQAACHAVLRAGQLLHGTADGPLLGCRGLWSWNPAASLRRLCRREGGPGVRWGPRYGCWRPHGAMAALGARPAQGQLARTYKPPETAAKFEEFQRKPSGTKPKGYNLITIS
jgi:hypothetical protein